MLLVKDLTGFGDLQGVMCDFEKIGDMLQKHNHDDRTAHITIVARGSIKASSHDWEKIIVAGQLADFKVNEPHEIMALEDNTRIFNIVKRHVV
jgi:quercetin dioxygenase-like cupin family protein